MSTEEIKKDDSDEEDQEEIRDIVGDSIRKCVNYQHSKNTIYQMDKILSVNLNPEKNQFKQIEKILSESSYKSCKPQSQLKALKKNQQKLLTVFWNNPVMNNQLTLTHYSYCQTPISDIILSILSQINLQISRYQLIIDYTLYNLTKSQENGELEQSFSEPLSYTTTLQQSNSTFFRLDPKDNNFIYYNQTDGYQICPQRKSGYFAFDSIASTGAGTNSEQINQDNSIIECYSLGISQLLEIQQLTKNGYNDGDENSEDSLNPEIQTPPLQKLEQIRQSKCIKNRPIDQKPAQVTSCNLFSFLKLFRNKKQKQ